jgi:hypothetical protein
MIFVAMRTSMLLHSADNLRPAPGVAALLNASDTSRHRQPAGAYLRMPGGKACGKQAAQHTGKQPDERTYHEAAYADATSVARR